MARGVIENFDILGLEVADRMGCGLAILTFETDVVIELYSLRYTIL